MEENDNDIITVFVPSVPAITIDVLHMVERNLVTLLNASHLDIANCITEWRISSNKVVGKVELN